ncbi:MAG TPA: methyltransferase domain-containing protein, partial [Thermoguttaceae bacterium]|nr:methyltransferase domain-containing protein [Thermoguttaceae bacterium]
YSRYMSARRVIRSDAEAVDTAADVVCPAEQMPFADSAFDLIFANWMIYKTDIVKSLREIVRVLRPGGEGVLSYGTPDPNYVTSLTATLQSLFVVDRHFALDYFAGRAVRRAEAIQGTLRPDAAEAFDLQFEPPVLALVAHWDDEVLSLGKTLRQHGAGWTVACATHRDQEPTYRAIFDRIMEALGCAPVTLDIRQRERAWDPAEMERKTYTRTIRRVPLTTSLVREKLEEQLGDLARFKTVLTHSPNGDYGTHAQHKELCAAAVEIFNPTAAVWGFNLKAGTAAVELNGKDRRQKLGLIQLYKPHHRLEDVPSREYFIRLRPENV